MEELTYTAATEKDLPFIMETYHENLAALHGTYRSCDVWKKLLSEESSKYYIVCRETPVAWFRIDLEDDGFWLGMLQVKPACHRQGIGNYVLSVTEDLAKQGGFRKIGIHATEDNLAAKALYLSAGYLITETGPCTTADGQDRIGCTFEKELNF